MSVIIDSTTILWPSTLPTPLLDRQITKDPRTWANQMESNRTRNRPTGDGSVKVMAADFNFTREEYAEFKQFFEVTLVQGTLTFVMETLEQDDSPQLARQTLYQLAIYDVTYTWNQDDNLYAVSANFQVNAKDYTIIDNPFYDSPLTNDTVTYTTECRETFQISWSIDTNYTSGLDVIQTAASANGPWYDYIPVVASAAEMTAGTKNLLINNSYNGDRHFRRTRNGFPATFSFSPLPSVIPPFDLTITATAPADFPLRMAGPFPRAISYIENQWLNNTLIYVEPRARLVYSGVDINGNWDGIPTVISSPNVSDPDGLRWTTSTADPADVLTWPPPLAEGQMFNARLYLSVFGGVVQARCLSGTCQSPIMLYVIDRRFDVYPLVDMPGRGVSAGGAFCTLPVGPDQNGNFIDSGQGCSAFGDETGIGLETEVTNVLCDQLQVKALSSSGNSVRNGLLTIYVKETGPITDGNGFVGSLVWPAKFTGATLFFADNFTRTPRGARYGAFWDVVPELFESFRVVSAGEFQTLQLVKAFQGETTDNHLAGAGNQITAHCQMQLSWLLSKQDGLSCFYNDNKDPTFRTLDSTTFWVSPYDDTWDASPAPPLVIPNPFYVPPLPPFLLDGNRELWEEYNDSTDCLTDGVTYDGDVGWNDTWAFKDRVDIEGWELWDGYPSFADGDASTYVLNTGMAFTGAWTLTNVLQPNINYGIEDWESYTDQALPPGTLVSLNLDFGWMPIDDTDPSLGQEPWQLNNTLIGSELWETYTDQTLTAGVSALNFNDDHSWLASDNWKFNI